MAAGCAQRAAFGVVDEQVVDGDVEGLGDADDSFEAGCDFVVLVAGHLPGVGVDFGGEFGLGPAGFGAQRFEAVAVEGLGSGVRGRSRGSSDKKATSRRLDSGPATVSAMSTYGPEYPANPTPYGGPQPASYPQPAGYPPPDAPGGYGYGPPPSYPYGPPPPTRKSRKGLWIGLSAGFVVLALIAGVGIYAVLQVRKVLPSGEVSMTLVQTAGGRARVDNPSIKLFPIGWREKMTAVGVSSPLQAYYQDPAEDASVPPAFFAGGFTGSSVGTGGNGAATPATVLRTFFGGATLRDFSPGPLGGKLQCQTNEKSYQGDPIWICAWADTKTIGVILVALPTVEEAAALLVKMRADIEKK